MRHKQWTNMLYHDERVCNVAIRQIHTLWRVKVNKIWLRSEHDLLQDDSETVDVSFLSSVDRSSCQTQQFRCCPQLITVISELTNLNKNLHGQCSKYQCENRRSSCA